ncbi:MAG TPA: hypothetical protein VF974_04200 [Patescibacteria group bacterium]
MSTKSFGVLFYLKSRSFQTHEESEVYLRITVNKARLDLYNITSQIWKKVSICL